MEEKVIKNEQWQGFIFGPFKTQLLLLLLLLRVNKQQQKKLKEERIVKFCFREQKFFSKMSRIFQKSTGFYALIGFIDWMESLSSQSGFKINSKLATIYMTVIDFPLRSCECGSWLSAAMINVCI